MANNRKVAKLTRKALFLLNIIFYLARTNSGFTLLTGVFIKNSLLTACSYKTHPTIKQPETSGQIGPDRPTSDGPETRAREGMAANKRPVTGGCVASPNQRQIIRDRWRR